MKKFLVFAGSFTLVFVVLHVLSGMLLTMFYTPSIQWEEVSSLQSQVVFGKTSFMPTFVISFVALVMAFGSSKLIDKKAVH
ncbi:MULTISPECIES: hypothetical protein [unclassified Lysinibacillus]|uniref:hypothetical protein n=1 Tax=unclassified Lysinibacillus TaxID=2636778 RepID=UPI002012BAD3|nr:MULTISPECIES: hypothetical protein [unclassified Lysinibacillus]MCL1694744.1 hypothetical protein [Lysinibacillus sp. BPa_S21]MCL1699597.1 hypothetical protein [Lysinibacillus sp. Bpr_S20]